MAKRIPLSGTVVVRDGKRVRPEIGKPFNYTADEIKDLEGRGAKLAKPADVSDEDIAAASSTTGATGVTGQAGVGPSAESSQAAASGGKKKATAGKSDAENAGKPNPNDDAGKGGDADDDL